MNARNLTLSFALVVLTACAAGPPRGALPFHEVSEAPPGLATIYIYRTAHQIGSAVWPEVHIGEQRVVSLKNGSYTVVHALPGNYRISTKKNTVLSGMRNVEGAFHIADSGSYFLSFDRSFNQFTDMSSGFASPSFTTNYERWTMKSREAALDEISTCYFVEPHARRVAP
jgi:hypothetical protein